MSSQGQTLENNCLVIRYFLYFSLPFLRQTFCTFSFTLRGFYTVYSLPALFNVKGVAGKDAILPYVGHLYYNVISDLFSSHICTSWSSWQEVVWWKNYSPNQESTAAAVTCYGKLFVGVTVWFQVLAVFCKAP